MQRSPSRLLRPLVAATAVVVAAAAGAAAGSAGAASSVPPAAPGAMDCSQAAESFDDSALPGPQEVFLTLRDNGDGFAALRYEAPTALVAGAVVVAARARPELAASGDISVTFNGQPALDITGIPAGMTCRFELTSLPGYYVATSPASGATVDWWVSGDLSSVPDFDSQISLASNLVGGEANFTDACDILSSKAVGVAVPAGVLGVLGPVTEESAAPPADAWQSECLWSVALGDGTTEPMALGVALVVAPPGDQAVAEFTSNAEADSALPGFLEVNRRCYLLDHTVSCLVDDVSFAVAVAGNVVEGSPQAQDLDTLAVTLAVNVANRLE